MVRRGTVRGIRMEGGVELPLAMLDHGGELFGEHTCLLDAAQPVTVRAASDAVLLVIPQQTVRTILERNPQRRKRCGPASSSPSTNWNARSNCSNGATDR